MRKSWSDFGTRWIVRAAATTKTALNEALRRHIQRAKEPLEKKLRRVIREELGSAS
jgi:hypothetical protein